mmetsp:Transcript_13043/g.27878  ORF Transcript_13043/g.27878 Transcript_13043/m.27878 type:complete len:220 (-) Transcript_13043:1458-2117(-)
MTRGNGMGGNRGRLSSRAGQCSKGKAEGGGSCSDRAGGARQEDAGQYATGECGGSVGEQSRRRALGRRRWRRRYDLCCGFCCSCVQDSVGGVVDPLTRRVVPSQRDHHERPPAEVKQREDSFGRNAREEGAPRRHALRPKVLSGEGRGGAALPDEEVTRRRVHQAEQLGPVASVESPRVQVGQERAAIDGEEVHAAGALGIGVVHELAQALPRRSMKLS